MTGQSDGLLLTDDELAAVGFGLGLGWPGPLPTVTEDVDAVLAAVERGRRALAVRGLLSQEHAGDFGSLTGPLLESVAGALDGGVRCGVSVTDERLDVLDVGPSYYHYGRFDAETWITDVVLSSGVHEIVVSRRLDCLEMLRAVIGAAHTDGVESRATDTAWLCVIGDPSTAQTLLVGRAVLRRESVEAGAGGAVQRCRIEDATSVDEALEWLGIIA